jgi:putative membrane protein
MVTRFALVLSLTLGALLPATHSLAATDRHAQNTPGNRLKASERKFVQEAAKGSLMEVELGRMAAEKAKTPDVRKFGEQMVRDHGQASQELAGLAKAKGVQVRAEPDASVRREADRLRKHGDEDFDHKYMGEMVKDHEKDVKDFRRMAREARDPDLRGWVEKTLPVLEGHLKMAREVADATGAPRGARGNRSAQMNPAR